MGSSFSRHRNRRDAEKQRNQTRDGRDVRDEPSDTCVCILQMLQVLASPTAFYSHACSSWRSFRNSVSRKQYSLLKSVTWVYVRFIYRSPHELHHDFYAFSLHMSKSRVAFPPTPDALLDSAAAVLDKKLYLIGGQRSGIPFRCVYVCDLAESYRWDRVCPTIVPRQKALTASLNGKIYVFRGCGEQIDPWAEVYDPLTSIWTGVPASESLRHVWRRIYFNSLRYWRQNYLLSTVVLSNDNTILIRGVLGGIAFCVTDSSWSPISENFTNHWSVHATAAVVGNKVFTCYRDYHDGHEEFSIRAYDIQNNVWLMVQGLDMIFHKNSHRSQFMSADGKLIIYHKWEKPPDSLRFSIIQINQIHEACVRVSLLGRFTYRCIPKDWDLAPPAQPNSTSGQ